MSHRPATGWLILRKSHIAGKQICLLILLETFNNLSSAKHQEHFDTPWPDYTDEEIEAVATVLRSGKDAVTPSIGPICLCSPTASQTAGHVTGLSPSSRGWAASPACRNPVQKFTVKVLSTTTSVGQQPRFPSQRNLAKKASRFKCTQPSTRIK